MKSTCIASPIVGASQMSVSLSPVSTSKHSGQASTDTRIGPPSRLTKVCCVDAIGPFRLIRLCGKHPLPTQFESFPVATRDPETDQAATAPIPPKADFLMPTDLQTFAIPSSLHRSCSGGSRRRGYSMFKLSFSGAVIASTLATLSACAASTEPDIVASKHMIIGPKGYSVDWGLPLTGSYWVPDETKDNIKSASDACNAPPSMFVYHHIPRPPWFSYMGLRFPDRVTDKQKSCVVMRLKAVPALTVYPKRK